MHNASGFLKQSLADKNGGCCGKEGRQVSKDTFLKGALILTFAGIIVKVIGSVNRILLSRLLGGGGIGLYQMAYPIYLLALSVSSAGIPVAISIIVAEKIAISDFYGANRVFRISLKLLGITGIIFTFLLYFGAGWLIEEHFVRDARAYYAIVALAPAIFFVTVLSPELPSSFVSLSVDVFELMLLRRD